MNILFLFQRFSFSSSTIYLDLVEECVRRGHGVCVAAGTSEDVDSSTLVSEHGCRVAYVPLPDQFHAGKIKKGIVQLLIEPIFLAKIKKLLWDEKFDLIVYPTPPITLAGVVSVLRKHYGASTYLMLKDIFPQNAVDLKMMGASSPVYHYFRHLEKKLYRVSDRIGCMSPANVDYVRKHNPETADRLELFPNTVRIVDRTAGNGGESGVEFDAAGASCASNGEPVRFVFGGNLGKPQAVDVLLEGIRMLDEQDVNAEFLIIGDGTEAARCEAFIRSKGLGNCRYYKALPRDEYEKLLSEQDIGIISLSPDFTIPNFPSRLLSYMQMAKPVMVVTDRVSDIGAIVTDQAECGYYTPSDDLEGFVRCVKQIVDERDLLPVKGLNGRRFLTENYNVEMSVDILCGDKRV